MGSVLILGIGGLVVIGLVVTAIVMISGSGWLASRFWRRGKGEGK